MIQILEEYLETESCVYKLYYGDRYVVVKGKTLAGSIYLIERGYVAFIAAGGGTGRGRGGEGQKEWDGTNSYYFQFYSYIYDNPDFSYKVEVILETNDAYRLLKTEYLVLKSCLKDKKCLNSNVTSYIPKFSVKTGTYGWITKRNVTDFRRFLTKWDRAGLVIDSSPS